MDRIEFCNKFSENYTPFRTMWCYTVKKKNINLSMIENINDDDIEKQSKQKNNYVKKYNPQKINITNRRKIKILTLWII